jgi:hypothetical protein
MLRSRLRSASACGNMQAIGFAQIGDSARAHLLLSALVGVGAPSCGSDLACTAGIGAQA